MNVTTAPPYVDNTGLSLGLTDVEKLAATVIYTVISLLCLFGNGMVIFIIVFFKQMRRMKMNLLMLNLAVSDLLLGTVCTFFTYYPMLVCYPSAYPWNGVICKFTGFLQMTCVLTSSYTLVVISIDRYLAIMYPLNNRIQMTHVGALYAVVGIWIASAIVCSPITVALQYTDGSCYENWGQSAIGLVGNYMFSIGFVIIQYFVALAIIVITYGLICHDLLRSSAASDSGGRRHSNVMMMLLKRKKASPSSTTTTTINGGANGADAGGGATTDDGYGATAVYVPPPMPVDERREAVRKMLPTVIIVSASYAICWLPLNTLSNILLPLNVISFDDIDNTNRFLRAFWLLHTLAMSQSFINPVVYYFRSRRFNLCFRMVVSGDIFSRHRRCHHRLMLKE